MWFGKLTMEFHVRAIHARTSACNRKRASTRALTSSYMQSRIEITTMQSVIAQFIKGIDEINIIIENKVKQRFALLIRALLPKSSHAPQSFPV